jgi:hypothetical protein
LKLPSSLSSVVAVLCALSDMLACPVLSWCLLQDVLSVGEEVTAMLLRCEQGGSRINLSTAHLEVAAGDMLRDRQAVYATAAQQVQLVKQQMLQVGQAAVLRLRDACVAFVCRQQCSDQMLWVQGLRGLFAGLQWQQHVWTTHTTTVAARCCHFSCCLQAHAEQEAAAAAVAAAAAATAEAEALAQQHAQYAAELRQREQLEKRLKQAQPQNGTARVLIADSLYQLALASRKYLSSATAGAGGVVSGRPAMAVMAAAFWQVPSSGWHADSAAAASAGGEALASQDQEQEW